MSRCTVCSLLMAALGVTAAALVPVAHAARPATVESSPPNYPQPSLAPVSWELEFKHGPLERLIMEVDGKSQTYWFMRYSVINNSGKDILFTPSFEIVADTGHVVQAFRDVPNTVFDRIKEIYRNPFLLSPNNVYGKLLQGEDNARDGVAIFATLTPEGRDFKVFIAGLSGETAEVKNPMTGKPVILQKSLELNYNLPGQAIGIEPVVRLTERRWVMKEVIKPSAPSATRPATAGE